MTELNKTDFRQGVTHHGVRYVLAISLSLAVIAMLVVWIIMR